MDGVTILAVKQTYTIFEAFLMIISICGVVTFATIMFAALDENILVSCVSVAVVTALIIFAIRLPKSDTLYEATVDESVSYQELSARYEIVSQRGQILTLREKEQNNGSNAIE